MGKKWRALGRWRGCCNEQGRWTMSEYEGKSYPQRKVREMRAEIERLREACDGYEETQTEHVREIERLREALGTVAKGHRALRTRLGKAIEPGSEEAMELASRLATVCTSNPDCARQLFYVEARLRGEG